MIIIDFLYQVDVWLLKYLNLQWGGPDWDTFWLTLTQLHKQVWFQNAVLPALILYGLYICRWQLIKVAIGLGIGVGLSDTISYRIIKSFVIRPRPFQDPEISVWLRKVGEAHGPSFPSNHAANVFAGAVILGWYFPRGRKYFYAFATLVAFSRPILGVHYPSDALAGALLGIFVGGLVNSLVLNRTQWFWLLKPVSRRNDEFGGWRKRFERRS